MNYTATPSLFLYYNGKASTDKSSLCWSTIRFNPEDCIQDAKIDMRNKVIYDHFQEMVRQLVEENNNQYFSPIEFEYIEWNRVKKEHM